MESGIPGRSTPILSGFSGGETSRRIDGSVVCAVNPLCGVVSQRQKNGVWLLPLIQDFPMRQGGGDIEVDAQTIESTILHHGQQIAHHGTKPGCLDIDDVWILMRLSTAEGG